MDNLTEIRTDLDKLYKKYKKNKSSLNATQTNDVVLLLKKLSQNGEAKDVAERLVLFSEKVCAQYFDELTSGSVVSLDIVESIINSFISANTDTSKERFYVRKYATIVIKVINNYSEASYNSQTLAKLIGVIAYISLKSDENKIQFMRMIQETKGHVYCMDFSSLKERNLININQITMELSRNDELKTYTDLINNWRKKYNFVNESATKNYTVSVNEGNSTSTQNKENISASTDNTLKQITENKPTIPSNDNKITPKSEEKTFDNNTTTDIKSNETDIYIEAVAKKLYNSLKRDMSKEQETIVAAVKELLIPINKAIDSFQGEIVKSRKIGIENTDLKKRTEELESQLSEHKAMLKLIKSENDELKKKLYALESKNAELDAKLNDAYTINSRESSLEAEKIRSELKESFKYLYEDWLEYEFSDVSEDNYESLQAIIKKTFRSLERNGIDFKGNNK